MSVRNASPAPRGFAWSLSPLQSRLDLMRDQARGDWGVLQRQAAVAGQKLHAMREQAAAEAALLDARAGLIVDPHARSQALRYLAGLGGRVVRQAGEEGAIQGRVEQARAACVALEVQIACLDEVRSRLLQAHRLEQLLRESREADAAWLGDRQRRLALRARSAGDLG
jgi:hypothetical protein